MSGDFRIAGYSEKPFSELSSRNIHFYTEFELMESGICDTADDSLSLLDHEREAWRPGREISWGDLRGQI